MTQYDDILSHLKTFGSITSWEAIQEYGITRLSAIIYNIKKDGYKIKNQNMPFTTRHGQKRSYSKYILEEN